MEDYKKRNNGQSIKIIVISILTVVILAFGIYFINRKPYQEKPVNNVVKSLYTYKTKDGRFTLKIVDKNNSIAINEFNKGKSEEFIENYKNNVKYYAYFNDVILGIDDVEEDEHYAVYYFFGYPNAEASGYTLIVNKDTNILEINPTDLINKKEDCMNNNFCDFPRHISYIKTDIGYFFVDESYGDNILYTTSWQRLGYVYTEYGSLTEVESDGIIVYSDRKDSECFGNDCIWELLNPTKYDANGNVVNN